MVGVDVHQGRIEADRTLEQRNKRTNKPGVKFFDRDRERFPVVLIEGITFSLQETAEIIAALDGGVDPEGAPFPIAQDLDEGSKKVLHSIAELLDIGMLVGCALVAVDRNTWFTTAPARSLSFPRDSMMSC